MKFDIINETRRIQQNNKPEEIHRLVLERLKRVHYKLYQYCSFDTDKDPFSSDEELIKYNRYFSNVLNKQIFASMPSKFNDPFDCIVGVSTQTILSAIVMLFLNAEYIHPRINKGEMKKILNGEVNPQKSIEILTHRVPSLMNDVMLGILRNNNVQNRLRQANQKRFSEAEKKKLFIQIFQDSKFINSFIKNFIKPKYSSHDTAEKIKELMIDNSMLVTGLLLEPAKIDFDEEGKISNFNFSIEKLDEIANKRGQDISKETKLLQQNIDIAFSLAKKGLEEFYNKIDNQMGITCFSSSSDIPLMWSHYANKHTGFVVEYDLNKLSIQDAEKLAFLMPVKYSKYRPNLDHHILEHIDLLNKEFNYQDTFLGTMISTIYTKSNIWSYEKEWRNLVLTSYTNKRKIPFNYISRIILGVKIPESAIKHFVKLHEQTGIPIAKYRLDDDSYRLVYDENFNIL